MIIASLGVGMDFVRVMLEYEQRKEQESEREEENTMLSERWIDLSND